MPLVLTDEQNMLRDSARGFYTEKTPISQLRQLRDSSDATGYQPSVWQDMVDAAWTGISIPEEQGGLGFGYVGLGLLLEEGGRSLAASPLTATVLMGATALLEAGTDEQKQDYLPRVAAGELLLALAIDEKTRHAPRALTATLTQSGEGWVLNGSKPAVADGGIAHKFIVAAQVDEGADIGLALVDAGAAGVTVAPRGRIDSRNAADLSFDGAAVELLVGGGAVAADSYERILDIIRVGFAAEALGIAQEVFERTLVYLRERKQFGTLIGSFQGLQHRMAWLYCELEQSRSVVLAALQAIDSDSDKLAQLASLAKARLAEYGKQACLEAIQMHGGMGVTDEFDFGLFLKRMQVLGQSFGDENFHHDRLASLKGF